MPEIPSDPSKVPPVEPKPNTGRVERRPLPKDHDPDPQPAPGDSFTPQAKDPAATYDLSGITPAQAGELLELPLMQNANSWATRLSKKGIVSLKTVLEREQSGKAEPEERLLLANAEAIV